MSSGLHRSAALALMVVGLVALVIGAPPLFETISASWSYRHSADAERAARPVALLDVQDPTPAASPMVDIQDQAQWPPRPASLSADPEESSPALGIAAPLESAPRFATANELELGAVELRFDDPPEAGARARLVLELHNRSDVSTTSLVVAIPTDWFGGYRLLGAAPDLIDDQDFQGSTRLLTLPGLAPDASATYELHLTALDDDVTPPDLRLLLADGAEVASPRLEVVGPRPRPGLARALTIPRLNLQASVVQTVWEPPRFVVGQIQGTALLGEGNSVLVGHLTGPAGDVFAQLDRLKTGDEVTAVSRGLEYRFMVTETLLRPNDDSSPMDPTPTPRLTMMTCAGSWNPLTRDYSHRLWVVAEPPELAAVTIAARAELAAGREPAMDDPPAIAATLDTGLASDSVPPTLELPPMPVSPSPATITTAAIGAPGTGRSTGTRPDRWRPLADRPGLALSLGMPARAGLMIETPASRESVPERLLVGGRRKASRDLAAPAWLVVRALQPGARWYLYPRELVSGPDGRWQADIALGGRPGLRHELRVGTVDSEAQAAFIRQAATRPNEPLDALPPGFWPEAVRIVRRQ